MHYSEIYKDLNDDSLRSCSCWPVILNPTHTKALVLYLEPNSSAVR